MERKQICPHCNSLRLNRTGIDVHGDKKYQRYYCRDCHRITTSVIKKEDIEITDNITNVINEERENGLS